MKKNYSLSKSSPRSKRIEAEKLTPTEVVALAFGVERDDDFSALAIDHEENQSRWTSRSGLLMRRLPPPSRQVRMRRS